ncbi:hypothetical protein A6F68_01030 [Tsuneonella dongtanensis]|uniref:Uncharacterized protein n=1 Tax=Tsuneonella dongtanensis TaxID=692370 RepID=A0A1B2ABK8_9SPHN|nr:hypothetical protein [Tsuneonella dongtanensis]ANY19552.1 hypothetical protein A6F68_01030 [Tsuneonella dongtanensis]
MSIAVKYGWVKSEQAGALPGVARGSGTNNYIAGRTKSGPLPAGDHNVMIKDIVFHGKGTLTGGGYKTGAVLNAVLSQMGKLANIRIVCGIRPGMAIEDFVESEYGGGMDQITREATVDDKVHVPYYVYVFPFNSNSSPFQRELQRFVIGATGFAQGHVALSEVAGYIKDGLEIGSFAASQAIGLKNAARDKKGPLYKAANPKIYSGPPEVMVLITSIKRTDMDPIVTHSHAHFLPTLSREITRAYTGV